MAQTSLTLFGPFGKPITPKVSKGFNTLYLFQKNIILRSSLVVNLGVGFHILFTQPSLQIADLQIHLRGSVPFEHCQDFKTLLPF